MAWLTATLETKNEKAEPTNRAKQYQDQGERPLRPPNPATYLTDWLFDVGPTMHAGMGETVITYGELAEWQRQMGLELDPWEAQLLRQLSGAYAAEAYHARKPERIAPYTGVPDDVVNNRDRVVVDIKAAFAGLKRA